MWGKRGINTEMQRITRSSVKCVSLIALSFAMLGINVAINDGQTLQ